MINSEEDRRTLEQDLVWTYTEIGRSMANAIQPGQMRRRDQVLIHVIQFKSLCKERWYVYRYESRYDAKISIYHDTL